MALLLFIRWLRNKTYKEEKEKLAYSIFLFSPDDCMRNGSEEADPSGHLADYLESLDSPFKIYGVSLYIYAIASNWSDQFIEIEALGIPKKEIKTNRHVRLKKSWDEL